MQKIQKNTEILQKETRRKNSQFLRTQEIQKNADIFTMYMKNQTLFGNKEIKEK